MLEQEPQNPTRSAEAARRAEAQEARGGGDEEEQKEEDGELREGKEDEVDGEKEPSPETEKPERFLGMPLRKAIRRSVRSSRSVL